MSSAELKSDLHKYIVETDDLSVLQQVKALFEQLNKVPSDKVDLNPQEERMFQIGIDQAEKGLLTSDNQVRTDIDKWIKEKQK